MDIDKASCLMARDYKGFGRQAQTGERCTQVGETAEIKGHDIIKRVYSVDGKSTNRSLTMQGGHREPKIATNDTNGGKIVDVQGVTWRKLTPLECERLQTIDDGYTQYGVFHKGHLSYSIDKISNSQRYKMLGNGFVVDVVAHILETTKQ